MYFMIFLFYRSGGMLRVQDLNVVLRHFGKLNRLKELSQVPQLEYCCTLK